MGISASSNAFNKAVSDLSTRTNSQLFFFSGKNSVLIAFPLIVDKKVIRPLYGIAFQVVANTVIHDSYSYRQFLKKHPNGHLNVTDFLEMFPHITMTTAIYRAIDTNTDGLVSFEEYLLALKALQGSDDQWLECAFSFLFFYPRPLPS